MPLPASDTQPFPTLSATPRRRPIVAVALALILFTFFAAGLYLLRERLYQQTRTHTEEILRSVVTLKSAEIRRWLDDRLVILSQPPGGVMATHFQRLIGGRRDAAAVLDARLHHLRATLPEVRSIQLFDPAGRWHGGDPSAHPHDAPHHAPVVREALASGQPHFVDFHQVGATPDDVVLEVVVPLIAETGAPPVGYAVMQLDPRVYLLPLVELWPIPGTGGETLLIRREGNDLVNLSRLRHREGAPLSVRVPVATPGLLAARALNTQREAVEGVDYRGEPSLGVAHRIANTPWLLIAKMDEREVYAETRIVLAWVAVGGLVLLGILTALGLALQGWQRMRARTALAARDIERLEALAARAQAEASLAESEARYRSLFENSHTAMLIIDPSDGAIVDANTAAARYYGWPCETLRHMNILEINTLSPEEIHTEMERARTFRRDHFLFKHRRADGSVRNVEVFSGPLQIGGKELLYSIIHDVTESRRDHLLLTLQAQRADALLKLPLLAEELDEVAFMQQGQEFAEDLTHSSISFIHFINADEETIELIAWSRRTLEDHCKATFNTHYPLAQAGIWADALREHKPVVFNDYALAPNKHGLPEGHAELTRLISVPVIEQGKVVMLAGVGNKASAYTEMDVETVQLIANTIWRIVQQQRMQRAIRHALDTERALNKKLEDAQNQLLQSEKMASIGQLAAGVAHELNNPIGFVSSNLSTLDSYIRDLIAIAGCPDIERIHALKQEKDYDFLCTDIFQLLAESKDGLARVAKIVRDLKDFSRAGEAEWQWADLHQGIDSTLNIVWNELKYKCAVTKEYGELPRIYCVPSQLNQVFMNLLVNAGHAIPEKGEITLRTGQQGDNVFVAISDTGSGIAPEHINRLFEPFFTTKPVGKGTGLGLSLAYSIVKKHHGRIEVNSTIGKGTTFTVWLPISPPADSDAVPSAPTFVETP